MGGSKDGAHSRGDRFPLAAFGIGVSSALRRKRVVLPRAPGIAFAPGGLEESGALHLMQGGVERSLFHLKLTRASSLRLLEDLVTVHRTLAEERENEDTNSSGEKLAIVVHSGSGSECRQLLTSARGYLGGQGTVPCSPRQDRAM